MLQNCFPSASCIWRRVFNYKRLILTFGFAISLLFASTLTAIAAVEVIPAGSRIINMGATNQTVANGLKPYGLVYALLKMNVPVKWVINQSKIKDGIDFTHNGINYRGSAFIIPAQYLTTGVNTLIATWVGKGVLVNTTVSAFSVDVAHTLNSAPRWVMDATTGYIAVTFLRAAEIPTSAYIFKAPSQLNGCDDIYVMPHAVPTWATHKNLYYWNSYAKGSIWSGCHAVSNMENSSGPDINTPAITRRMNFLMNDGPSPGQNAVPFDQHRPGTPQFNSQHPSHPIMQYIGRSDNAHVGGFETVYLPNKAGGWRPTTLVGCFDPSQQDVPAKSNGPAAIIAFGRGFGDNSRGWIMYEAGHDIGGTNPFEVAAQRAFFNFSFLSTLDKQPAASLAASTSVLTEGSSYSYSVSASSPVGASLSYQWSSSCGGTFSNPTGASTTFTPAAVGGPTVCNITCKITDNCGRVSFDTRGITVIPGPRPPVCVADMGQVPSCAGNMAVIDVLANDANPDGGPLTVTLIGNGSKGTFTNMGNGIIHYVPDHNTLSGTDQVQYQVCSSGGCCTSTITAEVDLEDANGCTPSQYYGIDTNITASNVLLVSGTSPAGLSNSTQDPDGVAGDATTYTDFTSTSTVVSYTLGMPIPAAGTLNFFVDGVANSQLMVSESSNGTTYTNPVTFTVQSTDDFLDIYKKSYPVSAGTTHIRITFPVAGVQIDAMEYDLYGCVNASPHASNDRVTVLEDTPVTIDVQANDDDPLGYPLNTIAVTSFPVNGSVSINDNGTITYLNTKDQIGAGVDSFAYQISNSKGLVSTANVYITIIEDGCPANQYRTYTNTTTTITLNPTQDAYLRSDRATSNYGTSTSLNIKGRRGTERTILNFDLSSIPVGAIIDSASLSLFQIDRAGNENVSVYRLTADWTETGATWDRANATPLSWTTPGGDLSSTIWATTNVRNTSGLYKDWNVRSLVQEYVSGTFPNFGMALLRNRELSRGTIREMRFASREGLASQRPKLFIRYRVPFNCGAIPNYPPLALPDTAITNAITPVTINVLSNDFDYTGTGEAVSLLQPTSTNGGSLSVSGNQVIYTPPASPRYNGVDTFTYVVTTASMMDTAKAYVIVTNAPPSANVDSFTLLTNTIVIPNSSVNTVTTNDTDPEGSALNNIAIIRQPNHGAAVFSGNDITYTPDVNYIGNDTLIYQVSEATGTGCTLLSDTALIYYTVNNRAPVAVADNDTTNPCLVKNIPVLKNDYDPEEGNLIVEIVTPPGIGTATLVNNNTEIQYTPPAGVSNTNTSLTYRVYDNASPAVASNTATVNINIRSAPENNPPIAVRDTFHIYLNDVLYADVLRNDSDPDNNSFVLPLSVATNGTRGNAVPTANGMIEYTPNTNYYGLDSFYYRVYDDVTTGGGCVSGQQKDAAAWAYVIIQEVPRADKDYLTVAKNTSGIINVLANDIFAVDGPAIGTIVVVTPPSNGNVSVLGNANPDESDDQIRFTPNINFTGRDSLVYQICDSNGDCDTAMAYILVQPDRDDDGIPDIVDLDDDNDGIPDVIEICGNGATSFACLPGGSDPAADNDEDGLENWRDGDYGSLNSAGALVGLDSDADGIPDFLDRDTDNDGIPDVVEALGVDADGDGVIDNFCDPDEDGLCQSIDASATGTSNSGEGLSFTDFDGDGIPNWSDLDSDNDGIPDIVEAMGTDADNNGRADALTDTDGDGWVNDYDGDADGDWTIENISGVLIVTSTDGQYTSCLLPGDGKPNSYPRKGNSDNHGLPNFLDLDSDGDGMPDARESGITATSYLRGMVTGALLNGWSITIDALASLTLRNSDSDGYADTYDIDSDNDGITDNVEGQPTSSFIVASDADTDTDGIVDVFDTYNGKGGNGITPYDFDSDGLPDYRDTDTDNDGVVDRSEGDRRYASLTQDDIDNSGDTDNDGLMDYFDVYDLNLSATSFMYLNVSMNNMGPLGNFHGPTPSGSSVELLQSAPPADRDFRNLTILASPTLTFNGNLQNNKAHLSWKIENEEGIDHYKIERSKDNNQYSEIGSASAKNAMPSSAYSFVDNVSYYPYPKVFYRIKQVSKSGREIHSRTISFDLNGSITNKIKIFPNPVIDVLVIAVPSSVKDVAEITISDGGGRNVLQKKFDIAKGQNVLQLGETKGFARGVYVLEVKTSEHQHSEKLIKQ